MTTEEFARVQWAYAAAREALAEAQRAYDAAASALFSAQCRQHYASTQPSPRSTHVIQHHCTLVAGHDGDHGKSPVGASPAPAV